MLHSKKRIRPLLLILIVFVGWVELAAQVTCVPGFPSTDSDVTIYYHSDEGNGALNNFPGPIYAHMGVITSLSTGPNDWKYVQTQWGVADPKGLMVNVGGNLWSKTINIQTFFGIPTNETVLKLAFVFRNQSGSIVGRSSDGSDIFYDVYPNDGLLRTRFIQPSSSGFLTQEGSSIEIKAIASISGNLTISDNGLLIEEGVGSELSTNISAGSGYHSVQFIAESNGQVDTSEFTYLVPGSIITEDPPAGTELGINFINEGTVRLCLYAPGKQTVFVIGDFNDWLPNIQYQMNRSVDGKRWWLDVSNLSPDVIYKFQYLVDGVLKIADPLSTLVLDPWNDSFIPSITYPDLPPYPTGKTTGIVSVFQTNPPTYIWTSTEYERPDQTKLTIYELLLRDFIAKHDYQTMIDTLDYLQRLGINAIELMPVSEFDGNNSWGYNPAFHKALDKYYGDPNSFKQFIDACHARNIAVIIDVVFNQATDASPLARLYWDSANNRPASNNPWLNTTATHPFSVFQDFNHQSLATKEYVKNCVKYWIEEFKIDGFRFDLSKGFTQVNSGSNVGQWGQYDASRIVIWKDYANYIWAIDSTFYVILEHFADNSEEKELSNYGMMLWGNMWGAYKDIALGFSNGINTSLANINYKNRQWSKPHLIGYMESHDEDRIAYECKTYGFTSTSYNVKTTPVALSRIEMLSNLFYPIPGPKMLWQFGEMGYDFHINLCENGTINNGCRTSPKPIRWDYLQDPYRNRLFNVTRALLHLRNQYDVFHTNVYTTNISNGQIRTIFLDGSDIDVVVVANVGVTGATASVNFPSTGIWYEYYSGSTINVVGPGGTSIPILPAGGYRLYTNQFVALPADVIISSAVDVQIGLGTVEIVPNPSSTYTNVWLSLEKSGEYTVEVVTMDGRKVFTARDVSFYEGDNHFEIDISTFNPGVYQLRIQNPEGRFIVERFVKI
jgi:glycosidase